MTSNHQRFIESTVCRRVDRIIRQYGFDEILGSTSVTFDRAIEVAACCCKVNEQRILLNPDVVVKLDDEQVAALIAHEIMHLVGVNGRRRLQKMDAVDPQLANLVFDIALERQLVADGMSISLTRLSDSLLLPPLERLDRRLTIAESLLLLKLEQLPEHLELPKSIRGLHQRLGEFAALEPESVFQLVSSILRRKACDTTISGLSLTHPSTPDHEEINELTLDDRTRSFANQLGVAMTRELSPKVPPVTLSEPRLRQLHRWLRTRMADRGPTKTDHVRLPLLISPTSQELRNLTVWPRMIPRTHENRLLRWSSPDYIAYLDVSGSMNGLPGRIAWSLLQEAVPIVGRRVFVFDSEVRAVPKGRPFRNPYGFRGGGTSYDALLAHCIDHRVRSALVITDGGGVLSQQLALALRQKQISIDVILLHSPLIDLTSRPRWWRSFFPWCVPHHH